MERVEHRRPSASDRQHTAGQVHQTALRLYFKKLSVLTTRLRTGHSWSSTYTKAFRFRHNDLCIWREREIAHRVLLDGLRLGGLMKELRSKVGDAFNSISILLKGPGEERRALHGPRQWMLSWTSLKYRNGFKAARHKGSMNIPTAQRPWQTSTRL
ncbi:uncharacterized protein N7529_009234 [Penicillium soppii]|uniref:uncharacterized protein n=1 Tax=Penicillium soppii TaxID=69789 RepID=UPI002549791D|nr:uncharacterized protein N7529_009234 [Penicillium soppii]KAJ5861924.1 hypothetical protein N7529_009234 [Penicillium soppii]